MDIIQYRDEIPIIVRGGGDLATGVIHRLWSAGYPVLVLESERPSAIRRYVAISEAVYQKEASVEDMTGVRIDDYTQALSVIKENKVPILIDPNGDCIKKIKPKIVIDAIIAKKNMGTSRDMADLTIALGPGFKAGEDVDAVVETMRGHNLARIIKKGEATPNTGVPGKIAGFDKERVIHSPAKGTLHIVKGIASEVYAGEIVAQIETEDKKIIDVKTEIAGIVRGMIREGFFVTEGFKIADVDPRISEKANCYTISDKARCLAGSVLELVCAYDRKYGI